MFAGKALTVNNGEGQLFLGPHGNTTICVSTQSPYERIGEIFTHRGHSSIYRFYKIWELALNAEMCMKRI